jgi:N-acetylneuraminic acid mutarotase
VRIAGIVAAAIGVLAVTAFAATRSGAGPAKAQPRWTFAAPMLHRRSYTASAEIAGKVYVAAGMVGNTGRPLTLFERFDPARDSWASLPSLPVAFSAAAGTALGGRMYVVGGNSDTANGRQVFSYDVRSRSWRREAPLPAPRTNLAVVALGGRVYAIGGLDPVRAARTVFAYSPGTRRWTAVAPLPTTLQGMAAVVFHGRIWVLGGANRAGAILRSVFVYDPRANRWTAGPKLPAPMETLGVAAVGQRLYAVLETDTFVYDAATRRWSRGPTLEVPRHALAVFPADGRLYAIGGCVVPQLADSAVVEALPLPR